jgi:hypothetical protein
MILLFSFVFIGKPRWRANKRMRKTKSFLTPCNESLNSLGRYPTFYPLPPMASKSKIRPASIRREFGLLRRLLLDVVDVHATSPKPEIRSAAAQMKGQIKNTSYASSAQAA